MSSPAALLWFRQDLRLSDNPALRHAAENGYRIIPVFILDDANAGPWKHGGASRWWLHESLKALNASLGGRMIFRSGDARKILPGLIEQTGARTVFWNRLYEPWRIARDKEIKAALKDKGAEVETFNAALLWEPWEVLKDDGTPYKVFTPFYRKGCLSRPPPSLPQAAPDTIPLADHNDSSRLEDLALLPAIQWYSGMAKVWQPGETGAQARLKGFLEEGLHGYKEGRDYPGRENVSRLSPHIHFGEISPRALWHEAHARLTDKTFPAYDIDCYASELGWREFSHSLLYYNPTLPDRPLQKKFEAFPWHDAPESLTAWQRGLTGVPIIDAGMRQLWQTGWMHNRVRMIVASFLVKNLLIHWRHGEDWFWDCLVDADLANNAASWQWVAGCGADAAPYFRIFNPVTQGEKFDPTGDYVRAFVPELQSVPTKYIHQPWQSGLRLNYPAPIIDLKTSRAGALAAFQTIK